MWLSRLVTHLLMTSAFKLVRIHYAGKKSTLHDGEKKNQTRRVRELLKKQDSTNDIRLELSPTTISYMVFERPFSSLLMVEKQIDPQEGRLYD